MKPLTPTEQQYVRDNAGKITPADMARSLRVSERRIRALFDDERLPMMVRAIPLTPTEQEYIMANFHNTPVLSLAGHLRRGVATIYDYLYQNDMEPYRSTKCTTARTAPRGVKQGFFNVNERDWL